MTNWVIKATSQEAWAGPSSGISISECPSFSPQQKSVCELKTFCGDFHLLPKSLLHLSTAPSPPHRPCPLQRRKKSSRTPHRCHNRNMTGFQLKPKLLIRASCPAAVLEGIACLPQLFLFYTTSLLQSLERLPTSWGEWMKNSKQTRLQMRRPCGLLQRLPLLSV